MVFFFLGFFFVGSQISVPRKLKTSKPRTGRGPEKPSVKKGSRNFEKKKGGLKREKKESGRKGRGARIRSEKHNGFLSTWGEKNRARLSKK